MGKDVKKKFTVSLDIDMKDAEKQVNATVGNLKAILADLSSASDKMGYFKDLVDYIGQIDTALTALKNKNKDTFDHMFDGLDKNLRKQLEDLFGTSGTALSQIDVLRDKLATLTPKSGIKELRNFAKEINTLFVSIGAGSPFEDIDKQFFGKANAKHIQLLTDALNGFATVWDGVNNKIKNGFGFGGAGGSSVGSGNAISELSKEVQDEIDKLKKQQREMREIVDAINNPGKVNVKLFKKPTEQVEQLKVLKQAFLDAASAKMQLENSKMTGTNEYLSAVATYIKAAAELKSAFESNDLSNQGMDWVNASGAEELQEVDQVLNNFLKKNEVIMNKVQDMYLEKINNISNQIEFLAKPYDTLSQKIKEYSVLQNLIDNSERLTEDEEDEIYKQVDALEKYFISLDKVGNKKKEIKDLLGKITFGDIESDNALEEFCNLLGVKIPNAVQKTKDAFESVSVGSGTGDTSFGISNANDIIKNTRMTVNAIEYAKKELVNAWKEYYKAAREASNQGIDLVLQAPTDKMDHIEMSISKMLDKWGMGAGQKNTLMSMAEIIQYDEVDFDEIEDKISQKFKVLEDVGAPVEVEFETVSNSVNELQNDLSKIDDKAQDVVITFQDLVNYISKSGSSPKTFFNTLASGVNEFNYELKNILQALNLIDSYGDTSFTPITSGFSHKGGIVSDQYTLIAREKDKLKYALQAQPKLLNAKNMGANVGAILDVYKDEANGLIYELQNTVKGKGILDFEKQIVNTDFLDATDDQIKKLIEDLLILQKTGLYVDWNGDNILFDKDNGFSFIDLASKATWFTASEENSVQENLQKFFGKVFEFDSSFGDNNPFVKHVYDLMDEVINAGSAQKELNSQLNNTQNYSDAVTTNIKNEKVAHEQNTDAINAENKALQAQVELKKKAQSMTWQTFALDESLLDLKKMSGLQSLADIEKFWKKSNYEKQVNFYEMSAEDTESAINANIDKKIRNKWYTNADFALKNKIENAILENDELRNAAMNKLYHVYKKYVDSAIEFDEFLNNEFTVYRGDIGPVLYGDEQQLSFSFEKSTAKTFNSHTESTKIIPKNTLGSLATKQFEAETEVFVSSDHLPNGKDSLYINNSGKSFEEYYNQLDDKMKREVDRRFIVLERDRVKGLLNDDLIELINKNLKLNSDKKIFKDFQQGIIPSSIDTIDFNYSYNDLAEAYNNSSEMQKKLIAYYASLYSMSNYSKYTSSIAIGRTGLLDIIVNDKTGVKKHVSQLTGESKFNLFDETAQSINEKTNAIKQNAKVIRENVEAQQKLNNTELNLFDVKDKLSELSMKADGKKFGELASIYHSFISVFGTPENMIEDGLIQNEITGEVIPLSNLIDTINSIEQKYNEDLSYVKDYLQQHFGKAKLDGVNKKLFDIISNAKDPFKADDISIISSNLSYIYQTALSNKDLIDKGKFITDPFFRLTSNADFVYDLVEDAEKDYGENLGFVKDYLNQVFKNYNAQVVGTHDISDSLLDNDLDINDVLKTVNGYYDVIDKLEQEISNTSGARAEWLKAIKKTVEDVQHDVEHNPNRIASGEFYDTDIQMMSNWSTASDWISSYEKEHNDNLKYVLDYLKNVFSNEEEQINEIFTELELEDEDDDLELETSQPKNWPDVWQKLQDTIISTSDEDKESLLKQIQYELEAVSSDAQFDPEKIANGKYLSSIAYKEIDWTVLSDMVSDFEAKYEENLEYIHDYLKQVFAKQHEELDSFINGDNVSFVENDSEIQYSIKDYENMYDLQSSEAKNAINNFAAIKQLFDKIQYEINKGPIEFMFGPDSPTINERNEVLATFDALKAKLKEIEDMPIVETEDDKKKLLELQAEAVGLQKKLRGAYVDGKGPVGYKQMYGMSSVAESGPMFKFITSEDIFSFDDIEKEYSSKVDIMLNSINSDMMNMLLDDNSGSFALYLNKLMRQLQAQKEITDEKQKQANIDEQVDTTSNITGTNQQLTMEREITAEKQKQAELDENRQQISQLKVGPENSGLSTITGSDYALESTLQQTNNILNNILNATAGNEPNKSIVEPLNNTVDKLNKVASGIVEYQNAQKINTSAATAKIADPIQYKQISDVAISSVARLGSEVQINSLKALADGIIKVEGAFKNADGIWEGFTVNVKESNQAVDLAIKKQSAYAKTLNDTSKELKKQKKAVYGSNIMVNQTAKHNSLQSKISGNIDFQNSNILTGAVREYEESFNRLETLYNKLKNIDPTEGDKAEFKEASAECSNLRKEVEKLIKTYEKIHSSPNLIGEIDLDVDFDNNDENSRKQALLDYVESIYGAKAKIGDFKDNYRELLFVIDNGDGTFTEAKASIDNLGTSIVATAGDTIAATTKFSSFVNSLGKKFSELWIYAASRFGVDEIIQQVRQGIEYVREINIALTELKKVTNETDAVYNRFLQSMSKTAGVVGSTVSELTTMAADWARLGYSIKEASKLAESTAILLNVSEFEDATKASEALISTMQAFQYTANESQHVVDILNEVGNNYAISSDGIATALQDSASALMEGGNNLEQAVALVAAANRVVQDPNSVGSALRTISLRLRGTSVEVLEEMGEETDGVVESVSKMQEKIKALTNVDIIDMNGAYKDTYTILKEIGAVWGNMSDMDKAATLELMAGKNRANTLSAILSNMKDLEGAYESALKAEGSALRENEAYLDSIQGRIDLFTNSVQTLWMNLLNTNVVKGLVDLGTSLIKTLDTFHGKILALVGAFMIYKKIVDKVNFSDMFKGMASKFNKAYSAVTSMASGARSLAASQSIAAIAATGLKTALQGLWTVLKSNLIYVIAGAITAAALAFDHFHTTAQEAADAAKEAFDEIQGIVESTKSTIQSLESELSTIQDKIDELDGKKLSFAEDQELERLKKQKEELSHSLKIQEQLLELQQKSSNKQAIASMKAYTKAASEGAKKTQDTAKLWGTIGGAILGVGGALLALPTGGASLLVTAGAVGAGAAAGGFAGNKIGEAVGSSLSENDGTYDSWYKTYTDALKTARKEEQKALEEYQKDSSNIDKLDKWQEAQQKTSDIETEMYEHLSQMQQYFNGLEYGISDKDDKELDAWNNFLDKFYIDQEVSGAEVTALDRIFGENASEEIQRLKKRILNVISVGKEFDFESAINSSKELNDILNYVGLSAEDVKNYFIQIGESASQALSDLSFNIEDYSSDIDSIQENISAFESALESLESGTFTYSDFIDLTQQFPELAKGVDTSTKSFNGLARNLKNAIKASPDELVEELKDLRKQLQLSGKSTMAIDQLIDSIEGMPIDIIQNLSNEYSTLTDEINAAKKAQSELQEAMNENPNEGYETRGEAMEYMKDKMARGEIGSESELWDVAEKYGFTYDSAKSINENADALAKFIAIRDEWFAQNDDGKYTFDGTEEFIKDVETAISSNERLKEILQWNYNEETGVFEFDFDNKDFEEIIKLLGETKELAGLTAEEFSDMMIQVGQFFGVNWGDLNDEIDEFIKSRQNEYAQIYNQRTNGNFDYTKAAHISPEEMQKHYPDFNGDIATTYDIGATISDKNGTEYSIVISCITPDGTEILNQEDLDKYIYEYLAGSNNILEADKIANGGKGILINIEEGIWNEDQFEQFNENIQSIKEKEYEFYQLLTTGQANGALTISSGEISDYFEVTGSELDSLIDKLKEKYGEFLTIVDGRLPINIDGDLETDIIIPLQKAGLQIETIIDEAGSRQITFDVIDFETLMHDNGYETESIMAVINRIFGEGSESSKLIQLREDILNIDKVSGDALNTLDKLGATYSVSGSSQGAHIYITSNVDTLLSNLHFTDTEIDALKEKWEHNGICVRTLSDTSGVEDSQEALDKQPENVTTTVDLNTDPFHKKIAPVFNDLDELTKPRTATITITTKENVVKGNSHPGSSKASSSYQQSMINVNGTAHAQGSWGAKNSGTSLVGELGPELLVRDGRWTTIGESGAEFTQVKKGDIIFNHKQTKQLLENGYITGRGKMHGGNSAFASGTAFASGGGGFASYDFSDSGGYTKYDVNNKAVDAYGNLSDAADSLSDVADEFREVFDWIEIRLEEIDEHVGLKSAQLENAIGYSDQNKIVAEMIKLNEKLYDNLKAGYNEYSAFAQKLLAEVPSAYREAVQDGSIAIEAFVGDADEKTLEAIKNYREWAQKAADTEQRIQEAITEIESLAKQTIDNIATDYENKVSIANSKIDQLDAYNAYVETTYGSESANIYEALIEENNKNIATLQEQRDEMLEQLNAQVEAGNIQKYSQSWYDAVNEIAAVDTEIINLQTDTNNYQDAINELHWEHFDNLIAKLEAVSSEAESLISILSKKDVVDENGNWTNEGITALGLYAQQMEVAEMQAKQYQEEIEYLNSNWKELGYTEEEYVEKLEELKSGQYDAIESYHDAKDAIVDLNKERVNSIKEGIEKEIEAYEELIKKKKEELDAEKDLHDFQKSIMEQEKDIADLERQLAALSGDNSASARAKRAQLEAELAEARAELEESYYDRSVSNQQEALDKELENFQEEKDAEIERMDEQLEDIEQIVAESLATVQENTDVVYQTLQAMSQEYSLSITESLTSPWKDGELAIQSYSEKFGLAMSSTVEELQALEKEYQAIMDNIENSGDQYANKVNDNANSYQETKKEEPKKEEPKKEEESKKEETKAIKVGGKIDAKGAKIYDYAGDKSGSKQYYSNDPIYVVLSEESGYLKVRHHKSKSGVTGWFKKSDVKAYAKGSKGVNEDQWALLHELGDELTLAAGPNGKLQYITRGTAIIPHDISENLMELGQLDPSEILDRNRPAITAPHVINNEINLNISYGDMVSIGEYNGNNLADLEKMVAKQFDKHTKDLNNALRKFTR